MSRAKRFDVFLSYSSADQAVVEALAHKLKAEGLKLFLDSWHLVPGDPWQEKLEEALDESRACAVCVGPGGIGPWQNEEMRSALEDRVAAPEELRVIPVLLPGARKPASRTLPRFLRRLTWVEFPRSIDDPEALRRLVRGIRGTAPGPGAEAPPPPPSYRSMAPAPEGFIQRREYKAALAALYSGGARSAGDRTVALTTALRGAGGFGKTALARALCLDKEIRKAFPDGILWTAMGDAVTEGGRLARVRDLIRWWEGTEPPAFETVAGAGAHLREALTGRRVLLVVDDVWSRVDLLPFIGLDAGSALLVTTRDSRTLPEGSAQIQVDAMVESEAVKLLGAGLSGAPAARLAALAARLGEWPLLLKLVNRQLRELVEEGLEVEVALGEVNESLDEAGLTAFDREDPEARELAVSQTLGMSLQHLPEADRRRFEALAVFPEDEEVPLKAVGCLWSLGTVATKRLCTRLHELSLLLRFDRRAGTIRLHDVVRDYLLSLQGDQVQALHRHLVDAYAGACEGDFPAGPRDGYFFQRLPYHLSEGGMEGELRALLFNFRWLEAKLQATEVNALVADYELLRDEEASGTLQAALRLSAHVLARDRRQLAGQLLGRLEDSEGGPLWALLKQARAWRGAAWLQPRRPTLTPPGSSLLQILEGHTSGIEAVCRLDERRVVSASNDRMLRVWDVETGQTLNTLQGHASGVNAVARLDERRVVSASDDGTLRVWNVETGQTLNTLERHASRVLAVARLDGRCVVSASSDGKLWVWDAETSQTLNNLEGHSSGVAAVARLDGWRVVSASWDQTLRVWDVETGRTLSTLEGHSSGVNAVARLDERCVVSASDDRTLRVWNVETGQLVNTLQGHANAVLAVTRLDERRVVSASNDRTLRVWDVETGQTLHTLQGHDSAVLAVTRLDERRVVSASDDRTLRVWDVETGQILNTLEGHAFWVWAVARLDERHVVSASFDGTLRVWDVETGQTLNTLEGHAGWIHAMARLDERHVVSASDDRTLRVWDVETGESIAAFNLDAAGLCVAVVPEGPTIIAGDASGRVHFLTLEEPEREPACRASEALLSGQS